jgi:hypothetical protein
MDKWDSTGNGPAGSLVISSTSESADELRHAASPEWREPYIPKDSAGSEEEVEPKEEETSEAETDAESETEEANEPQPKKSKGGFHRARPREPPAPIPLPIIPPEFPKLKVRYDASGQALEWIIVQNFDEETNYHSGGWFTGKMTELEAVKAFAKERPKTDWERRKQEAS